MSRSAREQARVAARAGVFKEEISLGVVDPNDAKLTAHRRPRTERPRLAGLSNRQRTHRARCPHATGDYVDLALERRDHGEAGVVLRDASPRLPEVLVVDELEPGRLRETRKTNVRCEDVERA
jgi:hypothetical protein